MSIFLEAIKQPICRGVSLINFKVFFSSKHRLEISLDVWKVKHLIWYIYQLSVFSKSLRQSVCYKAENWHASSREQYLSEHHFLDICQCDFKNLQIKTYCYLIQILLAIYYFINFLFLFLNYWLVFLNSWSSCTNCLSYCRTRNSYKNTNQRSKRRNWNIFKNCRSWNKKVFDII